MTTNTSLIGHLGRHGYTLDDARTTGPASTQATAAPLLSSATRFTGSVANGSAILGDMLTNNKNETLVYVVNDSPNSIVVYPFGSQTINGGTTPLTIAAAGFGLFVRIFSALDWRAQPFT
jgi:hypothetical protein